MLYPHDMTSSRSFEIQSKLLYLSYRLSAGFVNLFSVKKTRNVAGLRIIDSKDIGLQSILVFGEKLKEGGIVSI